MPIVDTPQPLRHIAHRLATAGLSVGVLMLGALGAFPASAQAQYGPVDPYDSSLRVLRETLQSPNDGQQHAAMLALRELKDSASRTLLERMLNSDDWSLRVDSVLGLAELNDGQLIDPAVIESLPRPSDREVALSAALALELIDAARLEAILAWPDLLSSQRVMLLARQRRQGGTPDADTLATLLDSKTPEVAGLALSILLDLGRPAAETAEVESRVREMIAALPPRTRSAAVAQIAEATSAERLAGAAPFIASLIALPELAGDAKARALGSLLVLSPEHGYPVFAAEVEADRSQLALLRQAAILLASGVRAPDAEWRRVRNGDPLLETIADAGVLLSRSDDAAAFEKLVGLRHRVAMRAALEGARRLGPSSERALGLACVAFLEAAPRDLAPALAEPTMRALARLAIVAPEELEQPLARASESRERQDALLLVLAAAGSPEAARVASTARGRATRLGESLIALLRARSADSVAAEELQLLGQIAGGAVAVDPAIRTQAAWLWLRHSNRTAEAIDALFPAATTTGGAKEPS
jgi:hypothetical protein